MPLLPNPLQIGEGISTGVNRVSTATWTASFNPLQIGEGISTPDLTWGDRRKNVLFQSPSDRGGHFYPCLAKP